MPQSTIQMFPAVDLSSSTLAALVVFGYPASERGVRSQMDQQKKGNCKHPTTATRFCQTYIFSHLCMRLENATVVLHPLTLKKNEVEGLILLRF